MRWKCTYRSLLHVPAQATSNLLHAIARNTINNSLGVRHNNRDLVAIYQSANEAACAKLIYLIMLGTIQV